MARPRKIHLDTSKSKALPPQEVTGAPLIKPAQSVADLARFGQAGLPSGKEATAEASQPAHQTHGAVFPLRGPITSVAQLLGRNIAKGSIGSFHSMEDYKTYLNQLSLHELHKHAVEEAKIVPIDDRNRLIRRLESEYTAFASRTPGRRASAPIIQPKPYSAEQTAKLAELYKQATRQ